MPSIFAVNSKTEDCPYFFDPDTGQMIGYFSLRGNVRQLTNRELYEFIGQYIQEKRGTDDYQRSLCEWNNMRRELKKPTVSYYADVSVAHIKRKIKQQGNFCDVEIMEKYSADSGKLLDQKTGEVWDCTHYLYESVRTIRIAQELGAYPAFCNLTTPIQVLA